MFTKKKQNDVCKIYFTSIYLEKRKNYFLKVKSMIGKNDKFHFFEFCKQKTKCTNQQEHTKDNNCEKNHSDKTMTSSYKKYRDKEIVT